MAQNTIKGRLRLGTDGVTEVRIAITHPMSIDVRDAATGTVKPGHYIEEVMCTFKGDTVLAADWGQAVSGNPYLEFHLKNAQKGDTLAVRWRDNRGDSDSAEFQVS